MSKTSLEHGLTLINNKYKHVLEFGVCRGATIKIIRNILKDDFRVFGFDSFVGLPTPWIDKDNKQVVPKSHFSTDKEIPNIPDVKFYPGWFEDTIPDYLMVAQPIALLHMDCDLYSSAKIVLRLLNNYIVEDTIIVFDEWFYKHNEYYDDHEQKAFYEWVNEFQRQYEIVSFIDTTSSGEERKIIKIK